MEWDTYLYLRFEVPRLELADDDDDDGDGGDD